MVEKSIQLLNQLEIKLTLITSKENAYSELSCPKLEDLHPECGPLGGVYTALKILDAPVLVLTCDMPMLKKETLQHLIKTSLKSSDGPESPNLDAIIFKIRDGRFQPFPGIYFPRGLTIAQQHLKRKQFSMQDFLSGLPNVHCIDNFQPSKEFTNINYPSDLQ